METPSQIAESIRTLHDCAGPRRDAPAPVALPPDYHDLLARTGEVFLFSRHDSRYHLWDPTSAVRLDHFLGWPEHLNLRPFWVVGDDGDSVKYLLRDQSLDPTPDPQVYEWHVDDIYGVDSPDFAPRPIAPSWLTFIKHALHSNNRLFWLTDSGTSPDANG